MTFRLLTYNIMHGGGDRIGAIAEVIKACAPDLVLLQEAVNPLNVRRLAELSGMADHRSVPGDSLAFTNDRPGVNILSMTCALASKTSSAR